GGGRPGIDDGGRQGDRPPRSRRPAVSTWFHEALARMPGRDASAAASLRARADDILRPAGALARLDDVAVHVAGWQRTSTPRIQRPAGLVFAGDHGVAAG